jgi:hypothetical protein
MARAGRCEVTEVDVYLPRDEAGVLAPVLDETWVGTMGSAKPAVRGCAAASTATLACNARARADDIIVT